MEDRAVSFYTDTLTFINVSANINTLINIYVRARDEYKECGSYL